ncbi:class III poly(R)-hydroxyalkanoic acid synthase subunit PhaC [Variovorax sp. dw_954]|uniref:class III poly(R)-hydroxyalkanoic acid synthase subunit PhaC n=1 Tax=Variovorax sp. dw_954 TaxID=2720078 RepID=UPI001BD1FD2D|nr:class III poly(R)-hydroxyalkanoic acid synthase subunit PhaC [Variovorax sp. dw_954]
MTATPTATLPIRLTPEGVMKELQRVTENITRGSQRLASYTEDQLAIATTPKDEVWRQDTVRLYRYRPIVDKPMGPPILLAYALVGRYQMIDLEPDRSFVRKLLAEGLDVYVVDWGHPTRAQRWLTIDDYVSGYLDDCVDVIRERHGVDQINLLGVCQGGVFCTCYAALFPEKIKNLVITVTPLDFHGDKALPPEPGSGYMNLWARALQPEDIDLMVETMGVAPGAAVGLSFLMMSPVLNMTKYTTELVDILDDEAKMLGFLHMERWIADRPGHPGEVLRQWFKDLYQENKLIRNELVLGDRRVDLNNIRMPVLNVYAQGDVVVPTCCSSDMGDKFGTKDYSELSVPGGHIGTFVGGKAQKVLAPSIAKWLKERNEDADA